MKAWTEAGNRGLCNPNAPWRGDRPVRALCLCTTPSSWREQEAGLREVRQWRAVSISWFFLSV
ncbi:hypothetical protein EYF80_023796 [Liparis tanakae]|uniref:Uncharacterized protein n=1 Tax=Liparis tanakae TaxID=230148 RepID=A0A4Z2HKB0_9TELE|nr:hypothetical protein EYF80_023796 [Liparis tanakae]